MPRIRFYCTILFVLISSASFAQAQDTLPKFSVRNVGKNRIIVGWVNKYDAVKQISIQRSFDSLGIYKTISTVADPNAIQNGFADTKAPSDRMFYRLFIVLDQGMYFFSAAKRPKLDTAAIAASNQPSGRDTTAYGPKTDPIAKVPNWVPSVYVYTNKEGYVFVNLPDAAQKKYRIKFLEEDGSLLFELKTIKEAALTLDKANFIHSGWFNFELYNDEKLVERNKFYLAKMF